MDTVDFSAALQGGTGSEEGGASRMVPNLFDGAGT